MRPEVGGERFEDRVMFARWGGAEFRRSHSRGAEARPSRGSLYTRCDGRCSGCNFEVTAKLKFSSTSFIEGYLNRKTIFSNRFP